MTRVTAGGYPTAQVARDREITPNLVRRWKQEVAAFPGQGRRKPHEEELARLKRELARVPQERDFLNRVAASLATPSSSGARPVVRIPAASRCG